MDFPKSMPDIGLVNGKFVDEDVTTGQAGTYIPSSWGNAVTQEILNVIEAAELKPDEGDNTQLLVAINEIASRSETVVRHIFSPKTLLASDLGLILVDSTDAPISVTLPASSAALGVRNVILRRVDNTGNRLKVVVTGDDRIKFHTHLNAAGYPFLVLMGAGDWWHLRSDGAGNWWPVGRNDATPLGRMVFDTTTIFPPGGYGAISGALFDRLDWPWLWDHAQQSGMLTTEAARVGMEGGWTRGDGVATFRGPEARGEFIRVLDGTRAVDVSRIAGSSQAASEVLSGGGEGRSADVRNYDKRIALSASRLTGNETSSAHHWDAIRPRNIAYPGRIKLI